MSAHSPFMELVMRLATILIMKRRLSMIIGSKPENLAKPYEEAKHRS